MGKLEAFCPRCSKKQPVKDINHLAPMGRGRNDCDKKTWAVSLDRVSIWVECTVCSGKFIYTPERNANNGQSGTAGTGNTKQQ